jgi:hypothetical protein
MMPLSPESLKDDVLTHLDSTSKAIVDALNLALKETKQHFHSLGTPLDAEKLFDKSYFSHTMRYIAKRALGERGLQVRIEDEAEAGYQIGQAANTGIVLEVPGIFARVLKSPLDEELPPAGSEARAEFYEQKQYKLPFPPLEGEASQPARAESETEDSKALHLVYAWDVSPGLDRIFLKLACPKARSGECRWQHIFPDGEMQATGVASPVTPVAPPPIAAAASAANTNLDISPKTDEGNKEKVKQGAAKRA